MKKETKHGARTDQKPLARLAPVGDLGPIEDRFAYEEAMNQLPPEDREFVAEQTRFADLWRFVSEQGLRLPADVVMAVTEMPTLRFPERTERMREINQKLMEFIDSAGKNPELRQ